MTEVVETPESRWSAARSESRRNTLLGGSVGVVASIAILMLVLAVTDAVATGWARYLVAALVALVVVTPMCVILVRFNLAAQARSDEIAQELERELRDALANAEHEAGRRLAQVHQQEFEAKLSNALEMAEDEPEVLDTVTRALAATLPASPAELLLADNSHAHLVRMAVASPDGRAPSCPVDSPDRCPAARRAQVQRFDDSDDLDACPKLRDREHGRSSALCVPVSIMGRTVGVIHAIGAVGSAVDDERVQDLATLANLAGARIGLLRVMAETQLQASTDTLTGLLNRRVFENQVQVLRASGGGVAIVMADLDEFKRLNDTYGHETGDRALRLFAATLRSSLRDGDLVARHGGEEFAIALAHCALADAAARCETVRTDLARAARDAGLPPFTSSFGVVEALEGDDLAATVARADAALFDAKEAGRDRVVVHGPTGSVVEVGPTGPGEDRPVVASTNGAGRRGDPPRR